MADRALCRNSLTEANRLLSDYMYLKVCLWDIYEGFNASCTLFSLIYEPNLNQRLQVRSLRLSHLLRHRKSSISETHPLTNSRFTLVVAFASCARSFDTHVNCIDFEILDQLTCLHSPRCQPFEKRNFTSSLTKPWTRRTCMTKWMSLERVMEPIMTGGR